MRKFLWCVIILYGLGFLTQNSTIVIPPGYAACLETLGSVSKKSYKSGFYGKIPIIQEFHLFNIRQQTDSISVQCRLGRENTKQIVTINGAVNYNVVADSVPLLYTVVGEDYKKVVIDPIIDGTINRVIGKHSADFIIGEQDMVVDAMMYIIRDRFKKLSVIHLVDLQLYNPGFAPEYEKAIVDLAKAKIETEEADEKAKQMIKIAEARGIAIKLESDALQNPLIVQYKIADAMGNWKGDVPSMLMVGQDALPIISGKK